MNLTSNTTADLTADPATVTPWKISKNSGLGAGQAAHLARILQNVTADLCAKYEAGQIEHGGNLWEKPGLLEAAIEEALDLCVYLYTLREQRDSGRRFTGRDV